MSDDDVNDDIFDDDVDDDDVSLHNMFLPRLCPSWWHSF